MIDELPDTNTLALFGATISHWALLERDLDHAIAAMTRGEGNIWCLMQHMTTRDKLKSLLDLCEGTPREDDGIKIHQKLSGLVQRRNRIVHATWGQFVNALDEPAGDWCLIFNGVKAQPYKRFTSTAPNDQKFRAKNITSITDLERLSGDIVAARIELLAPFTAKLFKGRLKGIVPQRP